MIEERRLSGRRGNYRDLGDLQLHLATSKNYSEFLPYRDQVIGSSSSLRHLWMTHLQ